MKIVIEIDSGRDNRGFAQHEYEIGRVLHRMAMDGMSGGGFGHTYTEGGTIATLKESEE